MVDSVEDAVITADETGQVIDWNDGAVRILGYDRHEMLGRPMGMLPAEEDRAAVEEARASLMVEVARERAALEVRGRRRWGEEFPAELSLSRWRMDGRRFVTAMLRDVTERRQAEAALRASEAKRRDLVEHVPVVYYQAEEGPDGRWRYVSPRVEGLLGFSAGEWLERPSLWLERSHPDDRDRVLTEEARHWSMPAGERMVLDYRVRTADDRVLWLTDEATVVRPEDGSSPYWSGFLSDITERKKLEEQLQHQAFHDPLTGLANRALFADRVDHAVARSRRGHLSLAVLFLDLDDFKTVNDSIGHAAGDELLLAVAQRLRGCLRAGDTASRLGGDEFAVLLEDIATPDEAMTAALRIQQALADAIEVQGRDITLSASIGIALPMTEREGSSELLRNADVAMYMAKRGGKRCCRLYEPEMHAAAMRRLELAGRVRTGLDRNQFTVHYQPTVRLSDGSVTGFEALVRWLRPGREPASPAEIIDSAEQTGRIVALGQPVLVQACRQARASRDALPGLRDAGISVNVSARQLNDEGFLDSVVESLAASGLDPASLILEITESVAMDQTEAMLERLRALKALGLRLAVDDFGTGYSSLSYLQHLPIDILKVDKSFVDPIVDEADTAPLLQAIVRMGQTIGLELVAEGVERAAQVQVLKRMGCDVAQGFYFARPAAPEAIARLLRDGAVIRRGEGATLP